MIEIFRTFNRDESKGLVLIAPKGVKLPVEGKIKHVGNINGAETYVIEPGNTKTWIRIAEDVDIHSGAIIVDKQYLDNRCISLLLLGPKAVIEHYSHDRSKSWTWAYINGTMVNIPQTILAALGLLKVKGEIKNISAPPLLEENEEKAFEILENFI